MNRMRGYMKAVRLYQNVVGQFDLYMVCGYQCGRYLPQSDFCGTDRHESGGICSEGYSEESGRLPEQGTVYHTDLADG